RTPVEVPNPSPTGAPKSGAGMFKITSTGERNETGQFTRTAEIGERREVTALVLSLGVERTSGDRAGADPADRQAPAAARIKEVLLRYGARVLEEDALQVVALFGLGDADGRDTESAVRAALVILRGRGGAVLSAGVHAARVLVDAQGEVVKDERLASLVAS